MKLLMLSAARAPSTPWICHRRCGETRPAKILNFHSFYILAETKNSYLACTPFSFLGLVPALSWCGQPNLSQPCFSHGYYLPLGHGQKNPLHDQLLALVLQVVVCGNQSAGKSSVLGGFGCFFFKVE
eukprot:scaffold88637_cov10-Tisochrysis_lutea.AAC.1